MPRLRKRRTPVGARPGTLVIPADAAQPRIHVIDFDAQHIEEYTLDSVDELRRRLADATTLWVDVCGLGDEAVLRSLGEVFALHPLALEDIVNVPQRPNVQHYDDHALVITRMVTLREHLDVEQISMFVGRNYVLTVQERFGDVFDPVRKRIRRGGGPIRTLGSGYLAYALLDTVIDAYYPILENLGDQLEAVEEAIIARPELAVLQRIYHIKRELLTLRRSIWPQRELINSLVRDDSPFIPADVRIYLRDTYDHCVQLIDGTETYRELAGSLMDMYLSCMSNRQNEIMKVLTIMASVFIPLTFVAGIYGMNFANMPELHATWGYPAVLASMAVVAVGMVLFFVRRGWIGGRDSSPGGDNRAP